MIGDDISTVSRHLAVLKNAGVVSDDKRGQQVFYRLRALCLPDFLRCVDAILNEAAERDRSGGRP